MNFYDVTDVNRAKLQQGDVVWPVTFGGFKLRDLVATQTEDQSAGHKDFDIELSVSCITSVGIVLNQACDLTGVPGREKPIVVARVLPWEERIRKVPTKLSDVVDKIKALSNPGQAPNLMYLPPVQTPTWQMSRCVADLLELQTFPPSDFHVIAQIVRLRLSSEARLALQERISYCFGRFGVSDDLYVDKYEWDFEHERRLNASLKAVDQAARK